MNLSAAWSGTLRAAGHDAVHWADVGQADAADEEILRRARMQDRIGMTSDLDFGTLLATCGADEPSVVQLRTVSVLPSRIGSLVTRVPHETEADLTSGALVTIAEDRVRLRPLIFNAKL